MFFKIIFIALSFFLAAVGEANTKKAYTIGETLSFNSKILNEERVVHVYLPRSYNKPSNTLKQYPVLYVLDGETTFQTYTGIVHFLNNATVSVTDLIVVAIDNTNRDRDLLPSHSLLDYFSEQNEDYRFSGGADKFLSFIEAELIPKIEREYRTLPFRALVGESFGGLFALHVMVNRPNIFESYIAIDPSLWWNRNNFAREALKTLNQKCPRASSVLIATTPIPDGLPKAPMENGRKLLAKALETCKKELNLTVRHYSDEDHFSVSIPSLIDGLESMKFPLNN